MSKPWTSWPDFSGKTRYEDITAQIIIMVICVFALSSCGPIFSPSQSSQDRAAPASTSPGHSGSGQIAPLTETTGTQLNGLQPLRGVNVEALFAEDIRDPITRIQRVENAFIYLRRELDEVMPAILRLSAVEADIQNLIVQLEMLLREESTPTTTRPAAQAAPAPLITPPPTERPVLQSEAIPTPMTATAPTRSFTGASNVTSLRLGEHADRTRIVLDLTGPVSAYRHDLDNAEGLLIIELPNAGWSGQTSWRASDRSPLIASYSVHEMEGGGSRVILQLRHNATVISDSALTGPDRIMIDLRSPAVH